MAAKHAADKPRRARVVTGTVRDVPLDESKAINPESTNALQVVERKPAGTVLEIIDRIADNPNASVETLRGLFELQRDFEKQKARVAYNEAMARLQPKLPRITKHGIVDYVSKKTGDQTKYSHARLEDIDAGIRGLLAEEGFSISYDQRPIDKTTEYSIQLSHVAGHSETRRIILPDDQSGGKNPIQAVKSTLSYARRILLEMILNIISIGEDDDAESFSYITDVQSAQIKARITSEGINEQKLLDSVGADKIEHIQRARFEEVIRKMEERRQKIAVREKREVEV